MNRERFFRVNLVSLSVVYLGNPLGTDEATCFDICDPSSNESVYEFGFELYRNGTAFLVLEPVAWTDFDDVDNIVGSCSS